jgi:hypothetical protein
VRKARLVETDANPGANRWKTVGGSPMSRGVQVAYRGCRSRINVIQSLNGLALKCLGALP